MRLLFITGHPAHVHLFKNVVRALEQRGHEYVVAAVSREVTIDLLRLNNLRHEEFGRTRPELFSKALDVLPKGLALLRIARRFHPDLFVSTGSPYPAHVSAVLDKPHIAFGDTENASLTATVTIPYTDVVYTPSCYEVDLGPKHRRYNGYKELAYLHPKYFQPDPGSLDRVGLSRTKPYVLLRLASWNMSHDLRDRGFRFKDPGEVMSFLHALEHFGRVVVTSEREIDRSLRDFTLTLPPELMHDILAFARLYVGEGATMAAEAGVLGVPWVYVSHHGRGFLSEQQNRYGLGYWVRNMHAAVEALRLLSSDDFSVWRERRNRMLAEKEDVVSFMCRAIENWQTPPSK
jgi:hypothetical protein